MTTEEQTGQGKRTDVHEIPFLIKVIATGLFSGYMPWASGTFGSLVGILIYAVVPGFDRPIVLSAIIVIVFFVGVYTSGRVAAIVGHRLTPTAALTKAAFQPGAHGTADPSIVVIDEIVGMWVSLLFMPKTMFAVGAAFFLFRIFDIIKPPPTQELEKFPGGWGIMLDDVSAGAYANIVTRILLLVAHFLLPGIV